VVNFFSLLIILSINSLIKCHVEGNEAEVGSQPAEEEVPKCSKLRYLLNTYYLLQLEMLLILVI
jgi:hypothetical protein